jgi:prepilin-type N-terminal cleavage/methylation domain-containing protein
LKRESGFTLLEVLIALTIMAVGVALTLSLISGSLRNVRKVRTNMHLVERAQSVMETVLLDRDITGAGTRGNAFEDGVRWNLQVTEVEMPPPTALPPGISLQFQVPKVLSYEVAVTAPDSQAEYRLKTLKLVNPPMPGLGAGREPE